MDNSLIIWDIQKKLEKNLAISQKLCTFAPAFDKHKVGAKQKRSGFSAVGSAHVWGARGRWFESSNPDRKGENRKVSHLFLLNNLINQFT